MTESQSHRRAKRKAAGSGGRTEVPLRSGKRLDAKTTKTATEVERSGNLGNLTQAAKRLKESGAPRKVLQVPQHDMSKAAIAMMKAGVGGTIKNMSGTRRRSVPKK